MVFKNVKIYCNTVVSQLGYLVHTSASRQGVLGLNPIAARKSYKVYPGLGILQKWVAVLQ